MAGAGAIGQWLGAHLVQGGHDVSLLVRPSQAEAIRGAGLSIRGATTIGGHVECITAPQQAKGPFQAVVLTCKAQVTAALAPTVAPLLEAGGVFLSLQNGFGNGAKMAHAAPGPAVAVAVTSHGVMLEAPGRLFHTGTGPTHVGPLAPDGAPAARRAHALLSDAGLDPEWHDDMRSQVWWKAIANHAVNPLAATQGLANGRLLDDPWWTQVMAVAGEAHAVGRAAGVALPGPPSQLVHAIRGTLARTAENRNSMVRDVELHRATEIEPISGRIVRLARRLGMPALASEQAYRALKAVEASYLGQEASLALARQEAMWESEPF